MEHYTNKYLTETLYFFQCRDLTVNTFFLLHDLDIFILDFHPKNSLFPALQMFTGEKDDDNEEAGDETEEGAELHDSRQHYQQVQRASHVLRKLWYCFKP